MLYNDDPEEMLQAAAKKRSRRHLTETDEYVSGINEGNLMDSVGVFTTYQKKKSLCLNTKNEIYTGIEIQNSNILPRLTGHLLWKKRQFHALVLAVLPNDMLDFLDVPVPFVSRTAKVRSKQQRQQKACLL